MSQETEDNYDLKISEKTVGQLYPVLKAEDGEILDGNNRLKVDPKWKTITVEAKTPTQKLLVRVHANDQRRNVTWKEKEEWVKEARAIFKKSGKKGTQEEISKLLGFTHQWVSRYDTEPIQPHKQRSVKNEESKQPLLVEQAARINEAQKTALKEQGKPLNIKELHDKTGLSEKSIKTALDNVVVGLGIGDSKLPLITEEATKTKITKEEILKQAIDSIISMISDGTIYCPKHKGVQLIWSCGDQLNY